MENKYTILIVDDEENILRSLKRLLLMDGYRVLTAMSCDEGYKILTKNDVQLIISDQKMPKSSGTEFLAKVKEKYPDIIRTILSGYTDVNTITESVNKGHIYKFFFKPWSDNGLRLEIKQCLEQYELINKNRELNDIVVKKNRELKLMNEDLKRINDNLEILVQARTKDLEIQNQALELSRAIFEDMPLPALGISSDGMIVMCNKKAFDITCNNDCFEVGRNISEYLPDAIKQIFKNALDKENSQKIESCSMMGGNYKILIEPLSGRFTGKGATVVFYK